MLLSRAILCILIVDRFAPSFIQQPRNWIFFDPGENLDTIPVPVSKNPNELTRVSINLLGNRISHDSRLSLMVWFTFHFSIASNFWKSMMFRYDRISKSARKSTRRVSKRQFIIATLNVLCKSNGNFERGSVAHFMNQSWIIRKVWFS